MNRHRYRDRQTGTDTGTYTGGRTCAGTDIEIEKQVQTLTHRQVLGHEQTQI